MKQERLKPKASSKPSAVEKLHFDRLVQKGCCVTGSKNVVIHHIMHMDGKSKRRDHRYVVALTPELHNMGDHSVHMLGSEAKFLEVHGVDLVAIAREEWRVTELALGL